MDYIFSLLYRIRGLFSGDYTLAVWQILLIRQIKSTPFKIVWLFCFCHAARGMALLKFFKQQEKPSKGNPLATIKKIS